jgi:hypothetical protein
VHTGALWKLGRGRYITEFRISDFLLLMSKILFRERITLHK